MNNKYKLLALILGCVVVWKTIQHLSEPTQVAVIDGRINEAIKLSVYYETLCSDSRNFFLKQLMPTYEVLSEFINLDLIPYGKAKTKEIDGKLSFQCQHASIECTGNKVHACAIEAIADQMLLLKYITCMITDNIVPYDIAQKCGQELNINYQRIIDCANDDARSGALLKAHGIRTDIYRPTITFIPTVHLSTAPNVPLNRLLKDLKKEVCDVLDTPHAICDSR